MVAEGDAPPEAAVDGRLEWLQGWVALKLSVKPDKFKKLAASADAAAPIHHFLSNPDCRRLVVLGKDKDNKELTCAELPPPTGLKRRAVYFLKLERQALTAETMDTLVAPGDLLPDTLSQLHTLCETAYLPLLSNGDNSPGWPPQLVSDLTEGLTRLSALVYVTLGQAQGRTLLPLPPETSAAERRMVERDLARDKERVHSFEAAVVTWTRQIKVRAPTARSYGGSPATGWCPARARMAPRPRRMEFATRTPKPSVAARLASQRQIVHVPAVCVRARACVRARVLCTCVCVACNVLVRVRVCVCVRLLQATLKGDPESAMEKGGIAVAHPGPLHELSFWRLRADNLASIQSQLQGPRIRRAVRVLELTHSTYCSAFARLEADVSTAAEEVCARSRTSLACCCCYHASCSAVEQLWSIGSGVGGGGSSSSTPEHASGRARTRACTHTAPPRPERPSGTASDEMRATSLSDTKHGMSEGSADTEV